MGDANDIGGRRAPSPALVISIVSLFVALSGTAVALQAGSVGPRHLERDAVSSRHVKDGGLKGRDVMPGSLTGEAFAEGELPAGGARGYAVVQANAGNPIFFRAHPGLSAVSHAGPGLYCLTGDAGIEADELQAAVAGHWDVSSAAVVIVRAGLDETACGPSQLAVSTVLENGASTDFADFSVIVP